MRILQIETAGVRAVPDAVWMLDPDRGGAGHMTVVTGPPRCGLTAFLEAIVFATARLSMTGPRPDVDAILRPGGTTAMVRTRLWLDPDERAYGGVQEEALSAEVVFQKTGLGRVEADPALLGLMSRYDHSDDRSKVIWIPARRVTDSAAGIFSDFEAEQKLQRLSGDPSKYGGLSSALVKCHAGFGDRARFDTTARIFHELVGSTKLVGVNVLGLVFEIVGGGLIPLSGLSFSERNAFVLAALVGLCGLGRSIVVLDTPEMGLAPGAAAAWLDVLRAATPEAQWIVATRDPGVLASAPPETQITIRQPGGRAK